MGDRQRKVKALSELSDESWLERVKPLIQRTARKKQGETVNSPAGLDARAPICSSPTLVRYKKDEVGRGSKGEKTQYMKHILTSGHSHTHI